jgi:hypothetical protein
MVAEARAGNGRDKAEISRVLLSLFADPRPSQRSEVCLSICEGLYRLKGNHQGWQVAIVIPQTQKMGQPPSVCEAEHP